MERTYLSEVDTFAELGILKLVFLGRFLCIDVSKYLDSTVLQPDRVWIWNHFLIALISNCPHTRSSSRQCTPFESNNF